MPRHRRAFIYGVTVGVGGLGVQVGNALRALALDGSEVHAIGPAPHPGWRRPPNVIWHVAPRPWSRLLRLTPLRWHAGLAQYLSDRRTGAFARASLDRIRPTACYAFTQVALETLKWAAEHGVPSVLESPNGHLRAFRRVYETECERLCGGSYRGHPTEPMVRRVEEEYALATRIRVSSEWSRQSLAAGGVSPARIVVLQQPVDLARFHPSPDPRSPHGPLRLCFVGSLDLRKGFAYLLRAARVLGPAVSVELVGATGDRDSKRLLARERSGLAVAVRPGDPRPALARADLFVLPTLEDGSPFAVAEAMAAGLPVITTTSTGAAEWIRPARSGWLAAPGAHEPLVDLLRLALDSRDRLPDMGRHARADTERRVCGADEAFSAWLNMHDLAPHHV